MPTHKPRIQVTLDQDVYDIIKKYSEISGQSMSGFVSQTLVQASPALAHLTEIMSVAANMSSAAQEGFISSAVGLEDDAMHLFHKIASFAEGGVSPEEGSNPLAINKGVSFSTNHRRRHNKDNKNIYLASSSSIPEKGVK